MIIYLDESGNLGFDFNQKKTSRYLIIGLLVCWDDTAHSAIKRAVKRTLKNKLPKHTPELKGHRLLLPIKKYFLLEAKKQQNWCLYIAVADKKAWADHHYSNNNHELDKKALYDEVAKRLFLQVDRIETTQYINIFVDRSKNNNEIAIFDEAVKEALTKRRVKNSRLTITHRSSQEDAGLQAIDLFCAGVSRKYEQADATWYKEFSDRIAVEVEYKF